MVQIAWCDVHRQPTVIEQMHTAEQESEVNQLTADQILAGAYPLPQEEWPDVKLQQSDGNNVEPTVRNADQPLSVVDDENSFTRRQRNSAVSHVSCIVGILNEPCTAWLRLDNLPVAHIDECVIVVRSSDSPNDCSLPATRPNNGVVSGQRRGHDLRTEH